MIQPTYSSNRYTTSNYVTPADGVVTAGWSGLNISLAVGECMQLYRGTSSKTLPGLSMLSGRPNLYGTHYFQKMKQDGAQQLPTMLKNCFISLMSELEPRICFVRDKLFFT